MGRKRSWFSAIKRVFVPSSKEKSTDGQDKKTTKTFLSLRLTSPRVEIASPAHASSSMPFLSRVASQKVSTPSTTYQNVVPPKSASPRLNHKRRQVSFRPEPTSTDLQISATKIQAAYRGYLARRCFIALRGLVRLHRVVRGQNVKRQTVDALNQMQLLVRLQTQIHSRRIQMIGNQELQNQAHKNYREVERTLSKWKYNQLVDGNKEEWDARVLTKEASEERLRKKVEAVIKKGRAISNWEQGLVPWLRTSSYKHHNDPLNYHEQLTPRSSKSSMPVKGKQLLQTPNRTPLSNSPSLKKYPRPRTSNSRFDVAMRDDDSLTSCPSFSVPNYMQPTVSAKAKVRANSNRMGTVSRTPGSDSKRRFLFPLTPNIGSFKWNRGKHQSVQSFDEQASMGSSVSMPSKVGRKPFNRFV